MTVSGIALSAYAPDALRRVPDDMTRRPGETFDLGEALGPAATEWLAERYGDDEAPGDLPRLAEVASRIPMRIYRDLSLDHLCKVRFGSMVMMDTSVEEAFEDEPPLAIYAKITNGMWRWGCGRPGWNEVVDVYEGIRRFDFGHPDFEVTLDHTTSFNDYGCGLHSQTYLDGVFGYLVHYRGEHVMTLGFSPMEGDRLLIHQVQLRKRRGNRWLFRLPRNYLEHVIDRFRAAFPNHALFLVDGGDVIGRSIASYRRSLADAEERIARLTERPFVDDADRARRIERLGREAGQFRERVDHAEAEVPRLSAFYADTGRYALGTKLTVNRLRHYEVVLAC